MKKVLPLILALALCILPALSMADDVRFFTDVIEQGHSLYLGTYDDAPIEWLVLNPDESSTGNSAGMFLITRDCLTTTTFDTLNYRNSKLRNMCNSIYLNSFTRSEQMFILPTTADDTASAAVINLDIRCYPVPLTADKLFLLSYAEIEAHLPAEYRSTDHTWYTRNNMELTADSDTAGYLLCDKWGEYSYTTRANAYVGGFRPGMNILLDGGAYLTPAAGGKSDALGLTPIREQAGVTAWRLTLENRDETFTATVDPTVYSDDRKVTIDTTARSYDDVCCILMDTDGEAMCYGRVADKTGKASFTLPEELPNGTYYLMLFAEKRNGDYHTDYMSAQALASVTLTDRPAVTPTPVPTPSVPATGDGTPLMLLALLGVCSAAALLILRKRAMR